MAARLSPLTSRRNVTTHASSSHLTPWLEELSSDYEYYYRMLSDFSYLLWKILPNPSIESYNSTPKQSMQFVIKYSKTNVLSLNIPTNSKKCETAILISFSPASPSPVAS